ncbi:MAG TPA: hypothetical protein VHE61_12495 [Opitutaceae bacterium]|nr:hypothetical protein [Opitutaceae bacterium]
MQKTQSNPRRAARAVVYISIIAVWGMLFGLIVAGTIAYGIYADIKSPGRSHWTSRTFAEPIAAYLCLWHYRPIWQARSDCCDFDDRLAYVPKPGVTRFRGPEFDTTIHITPRRLRAQLPAKPGAPLVVVAGDSYAFGWGEEDNETFSALLQSRYGYHTVNTAVPGYATPRELERLHRLGLLTHVDALIIQYCDNDAPENVEFLRNPADLGLANGARGEWTSLREYHQQPVTYFNVVVDIARYVRQWGHGVGRMRALLTMLGVRKGHRGPVDPRAPDASGARMARDFLAVLDRYPELQHVPVLVTQMSYYGHVPGFTDALRNLAKERPNIVPVAIRYSPSDYYRFDQHLTPAGHRRAAAALAATLKQVLAGRTSSTAAAAHPDY